MAIVCHCEVIREAAIVDAIVDGASSLADVQIACGAAMQCGGCVPAVQELLLRHAPSAPIDPARSMSA